MKVKAEANVLCVIFSYYTWKDTWLVKFFAGSFFPSVDFEMVFWLIAVKYMNMQRASQAVCKD